MKRFYETAVVVPAAAGFTVELDGRAIRTPKKAPFVVPGRTVADAIAEEWLRQDDEIVPESMPLARLANTAIDMVAGQRDAVVDNLAGYGETDMLCYRVDGPPDLVRRQEALWSPWLQWVESQHQAVLTVTDGIAHIAQDQGALAALRRAVDGHDVMELAALNDLVTIAGSLVLGLAVSAGAADVATAWSAIRLDQDYQAEKWGRDAEAEAHAARLRQEFADAVHFLELHRAA